ncbi:MAG: WbqC family protein [Alistipes sp.]|nr:WbqC family protein [Alistipes sp.]
MLILPATYLPDIEYITRLIAAGNDYIIDCGEHYIKRSARNRTRIMTANGVLELTVPVVNANRPRTPMHRMEIDYSKPWQHQHWVALMSAYRSSPYFELLGERLEPFYTTTHTSLVEFNLALLRVLLAFMGYTAPLKVTNDYITAAEGDIDLRPKHRTTTFTTPHYFQLFSDRHPFAENLSIIDLLMSEGLEARGMLTGCF